MGEAYFSRTVNEKALRQLSMTEGQKATHCDWSRETSYTVRKNTRHLSSQVKELDCFSLFFLLSPVYNKRNSQMEETHRARGWERAWNSQSTPLSPNLHVFTNPEALKSWIIVSGIGKVWAGESYNLIYTLERLLWLLSVVWTGWGKRVESPVWGSNPGDPGEVGLDKHWGRSGKN